MPSEDRKPLYMIIYKCSACGQESGFTELDSPRCRYCDSKEHLEVISKQELTAQVIAARLKATSDNMMKNMENAFQSLPDLDKDVLGKNVDPEEELLKLMAQMQKLRDRIQDLKLKNSEEDELSN